MRSLRAPIAIAVVAFSVLQFLSPAVFTWDSYHYLQLSVFPQVGADHPLGFAFVLRGLIALSRAVAPGRFYSLYAAWQAIALTFALSPLWIGRLAWPATTSTLRRVVLVLGSAGMFGLVLPALAFVAGSVWSEATALGILGLAAAQLRRFDATPLAPWRPRDALLAVLIGVLAYQTRFQLLLLSCCYVGVGMLLLLRGAWRSAAGRRVAASWAFVGLCLFGADLAADRALATIVPTAPNRTVLATQMLRMSLQCTLRCRANQFATDCTTDRGRWIIQHTSCSRLIFGQDMLGPTTVPDSAGMSGLLASVGSFRVLRWLMTAPWSYWSDNHGIEMGLPRFGFGRLTRWFPDVILQYRSALETRGPLVGKWRYRRLGRWLLGRMHRRRYHQATALIVLAALGVVALSPRPSALFLGVHTVLTFCVFAYADPQIALRYLLQILWPGTLAVLLAASTPPHAPEHAGQESTRGR